MLQLFIITIVILGIAFLGIGVKMLFKKGGQFTKSCASAELTNGKRVGCVCSGKAQVMIQAASIIRSIMVMK